MESKLLKTCPYKSSNGAVNDNVEDNDESSHVTANGYINVKPKFNHVTADGNGDDERKKTTMSITTKTTACGGTVGASMSTRRSNLQLLYFARRPETWSITS